jgi:proline iminopeptidase
MMGQYKMYCPLAEFVIFKHGGHNPQVEEPFKLFAVKRGFLSE